MAMAKKTSAQKILALIRNYGPKEIAELDAEIAMVKKKLEAEVAVVKSELDRLMRLREIVGPKSQPQLHLTAALRPTVARADDMSDEDDDEQFVTVVSEADKPALRRKIVAFLKEHGVKRNDTIARELEVSKEVVLDLLHHSWFAKFGGNGQFTLTSDGHVEANRLAEK